MEKRRFLALFRSSAVTVLTALLLPAFNLASCDGSKEQAQPTWFQGGVIYEASPLIMSESGKLAEVANRLPEIKELGVKTLYVLPIFEHEPLLVYRVYDFYKIAPEVGTADDLKTLVRRAHELGIRVLLDLVISHSPAGRELVKWPDSLTQPLLKSRGPLKKMFLETERVNKQRLDELKRTNSAAYEKAIQENALPSRSPLYNRHPDWFLHGADGNPVLTYPNPGWGYAIDYSNPDVHQYFADIAAYYVREFNIDGWRIDAPQNNFDPKLFPNAVNSLELLRRVRRAVKSVKPDAMLFAENVAADTRFRNEGEPVFDEVCDVSYQQQLYWEMAVRHEEGFRNFTTADLAKLIADSAPRYGRARANFIENHDVNRVRAGFPNIWRALAAVQYTLPGVPMIYCGQEIGETDKFYVDWEHGDQDARAFYVKLGALLPRESLRNGTFVPVTVEDNSLCAFARSSPDELALVAANFRKDSVQASLHPPLNVISLRPAERYLVLDGLDGSCNYVTRAELSSVQVEVAAGTVRILFVTPEVDRATTSGGQ